MSILVSINCITYNHENYIKDAIESFLMQKTNFEYEILIGEDCSTDNTRLIVEEYCKKYPNKIRLITSEKNVGFLKNIVRIHNESKGKYIATCEGDDYWTDPYKLQKQVDYMEANPNCSMCFHPELIVSENKKSKNRFVGKWSNKNKMYTMEYIALPGLVPTASRVYRKYTMDNLPKLFYEAVAGDFISNIIVSSYGYVYYMNEVMGVYRTDIDSSVMGGVRKRNSKQELIDWQENRLKTIDAFDLYSNYKYKDDLRLAKLASEVKIMFINEEYKKTLRKKYRPYINIYFKELNKISKLVFILNCISPNIIKSIQSFIKN